MPKQCDKVDYKLIGDDLQAVVVTLDPNEQVIAEAGTMLYMTGGIDMQTTMSTDQNRGFFGNLMKGVGRVITGEGFFITTFSNTGSTRADVAFAAPYPGKILPIELSHHGNQLICQKDAFLCAARGTDIGIAFQKKLGVGFFGGEGFILQRLSGDGLAFIHGFFFATLTGPGKVYLQTLPFSRLADRIVAASNVGRGRRKGEGSILGGMLMGDT